MQQELEKVTVLDQTYGLVYAELLEKHFERQQHKEKIAYRKRRTLQDVTPSTV